MYFIWELILSKSCITENGVVAKIALGTIYVLQLFADIQYIVPDYYFATTPFLLRKVKLWIKRNAALSTAFLNAAFLSYIIFMQYF